MISELKICQDANAINNPDWGVGYVGGMPNSKAMWSKLKTGDFSTYFSSWAPWYNLHKMYAGSTGTHGYTAAVKKLKIYF